MPDIHGNTSVVALFPTAVRTSTTNGTGVDIRDYDYRGKVILDAAAGGTGTMDVKIQDSPDNSTFTDVSGATFTQVTTSASLQSIGLDLMGCQRYIRAVATLATSPSQTFSVNMVAQKQWT